MVGGHTVPGGPVVWAPNGNVIPFDSLDAIWRCSHDMTIQSEFPLEQKLYRVSNMSYLSNQCIAAALLWEAIKKTNIAVEID
eukprot:1898433-Amphidinium_carterae.1